MRFRRLSPRDDREFLIERFEALNVRRSTAKLIRLELELLLQVVHLAKVCLALGRVLCLKLVLHRNMRNAP
jgi:hypothetical protein